MGWFGKKGRAERKVAMAPQRVCDCCNDPMKAGAGYFLTTEQVVVSPGYWTSSFKTAKTMIDTFQLEGAQRLSVFREMLSHGAGQSSPWNICEECSALFVFDRDRARAHARAETAPEGTGRVKPGPCTAFAAAGWEQVFGEWPADVARPATRGTCDTCGASVQEGEKTTVVPADRVAGLREAGHLDEEPKGASAPGGAGHILCHACSGRLAARLHRAGAESTEGTEGASGEQS